MEIVLVSLLNGLVYGMLLFMLASGLTLIFSMMGVLNFAHASIYMIGAYLAFTVSHYVGFFPALIVAPLLCGLLGAAIEIWGLRRVHHKIYYLGTALLAGSTTSLIIFASLGGISWPWRSAPSYLTVAIGVLLAVSFVMVERAAASANSWSPCSSSSSIKKWKYGIRFIACARPAAR